MQRKTYAKLDNVMIETKVSKADDTINLNIRFK